MGCCASSAATAVRAEDELEELEFTSAEDVELRNQARRMFAMVDADGSGALDKGEVAVLCAELGLGELSASELDAAMFEMDDDRSGTVNFGEFLQWWKRRQARDAEGRLAWSQPDELGSPKSPRSTTSAAEPPPGEASPRARRKVRRMSVVAMAEEQIEQESTSFYQSDADRKEHLAKVSEARAANRALARENSRKRNKDVSCTCFREARARRARAKLDKNDPRVQCRKMFDQIDDDGSGTLSVDEIPKLARMLGIKLTPEQTEQALKEMDDDASGSVDFEEFFQWFHNAGGEDSDSAKFEDTVIGQASRQWAERSTQHTHARISSQRSRSEKALATRPGLTVDDMKKIKQGKQKVHTSSVWLNQDNKSGVTMWGRKSTGPVGSLGTWETAIETRPQKWQTMSMWLHESDHDFIE